MSVSTGQPTRVQPTRRERLRAQTADEIKAAARDQLIAHGPHGIQLRAVAREVGLTAPAVYRYFPSLEDLITALITDLFTELADAMTGAVDASGGPVEVRLQVASRAFRGWAVGHPAEFALIFGAPLPGYVAPPEGPVQEAGSRYGAVFAELFLELWHERPFPVDDLERTDPGLAAAYAGYHAWLQDALAVEIPAGAIAVFVDAWVRLYGVIAMEAFHHLDWCLLRPEDAEAVFERTLAGLCALWHAPETYQRPSPDRT
jgi:AcrR family transcriptional regulator